MFGFIKRILQVGPTQEPKAGAPALRQRNLITERAPVDIAVDPGHEVFDPESELIVWSDIPRYPAYDQGFPVVQAEKLLGGYAQTMKSLKKMANFDGAFSQQAVQSVLQKYAEFVQGLPASYQEHYYGVGGLLKLGLDVGYYSLQGSNEVIFSKESADIRAKAEPRWKLAAFVAGVVSELHQTLSAMRVTNQKRDEWNPLVESLTDWLERTGATRYWVIWLRDDEFSTNRAVTGMILPYIVDKEILSYIGRERRALAMMYNAISYGVRPGEANAIAQLVEKKKFQLIKRDKGRNPNHVGRPQIGSHIDPAIVDAMRSLVKTQVWTVNQKGSRVWITKEGCFIAWKQGGPELLRKLQQSDIPGVPGDTETIREAMQSHGIISKNPSGKTYWQIVPDGSKALVEAVKLAKPEIVFFEWEKIAADATFQLLPQQQKDSATPSTGAPKVVSVLPPKTKPVVVATGPVELPQSRPPQEPVAPEPSGPPDEDPPPPVGEDWEMPPPSEDVPPPELPPMSEEEMQQVSGGGREEPAREARELARLPAAVATLFRMLVKKYCKGEFNLVSVSETAVGIPLELLDQKQTGVSLVAVISALAKELMLFVPSSQSKKVISMEIDGQKREFVGIYKAHAKAIFGYRED